MSARASAEYISRIAILTPVLRFARSRLSLGRIILLSSPLFPRFSFAVHLPLAKEREKERKRHACPFCTSDTASRARARVGPEEAGRA